MEMFLSDKELIELTRKKRKAGQVKELVTLGIKFRERSDGSLIVSRDHVITELGGKQDITRREPKFNWNALNA